MNEVHTITDAFSLCVQALANSFVNKRFTLNDDKLVAEILEDISRIEYRYFLRVRYKRAGNYFQVVSHFQVLNDGLLGEMLKTKGVFSEHHWH